MPTGQHLITLLGKRFGRFVVLARAENAKRARCPRWLCRCDCGKEKIVRGQHLRQGRTTSCGCLLREVSSVRFTTHGMHGTPEELMFRSARGRAKKRKLEFNLVLADIQIPKFCPLLGVKIMQNLGRRGPCPESPTLDRRDSSRGYTRDNVWVISHKANTIKSNSTLEELEQIVKKWKMLSQF